MSKLYIVCVIYNIQIKDIVSLNSFKAIAAEKEDIQIIIFYYHSSSSSYL